MSSLPSRAHPTTLLHMMMDHLVEAGQDWLWGTATWAGQWVENSEQCCRVCPHGLQPPLAGCATHQFTLLPKKSWSAGKHPLKKRAATKLPASHKLLDHPTLVSSAAAAKAKKCLCLWLFGFLKVKQVTGCTSLCTQTALGSLTGCTSVFAGPRAWHLLFWDLAKWFRADDAVQRPILPPQSCTCSWDTVRGTLGHPTHLLYRENMFWIVWVKRGEKTSSTLSWLDSASQLLVLTIFFPHLSFAPFN